MQSVVHALWYGNNAWHWLLFPFELLFRLILRIRQALYRSGLFKSVDVGLPVIVVGNITAGGTGKTPVTLWLAERLKAEGFTPGIISRGYGGKGNGLRVDEHSAAELVGDEPLLLAKRSDCPVMIDADRVNAAHLLRESGVDLLIADDGLQHYRLQRDYEICVVDALRGLGNGRLLPAGPLREHPGRLLSVDQVLLNGQSEVDGELPASAIHFELVIKHAVRVNGSVTKPVQQFAGTTVNAAAAIGNPQRFFAALRNLGLTVCEHEYPDHGDIDLRDFDASVPLLITEKDAVKLPANSPDHVWSVPVDLHMDAELADAWVARILSRLKSKSYD